MAADSTAKGNLFQSRPVLWTCILVIAGLLLRRTYEVAFPRPDTLKSDFDAFHLAGRLFVEGRAPLAYDAAAFDALMNMGGQQGFFVWTYPPPYFFVAAPLSAAPVWLAYLVFEAVSLAAFFWVLRRHAGPWFPGVAAASVPVVAISVNIGQNGCLIAALVGLFACWSPNGRAGLPLGLLVIKPHLAIGAGLLVLFERRWRVAAVAAATVATACLAATLATGPQIWPAFAEAGRHSTEMLAAGQYQLRLMTSWLALARSLGLPLETAFAIQIAMSAAAVIVLALAVSRYRDPRISLGLTLCLTPFLSPYFYYYDLPVFFVGMAVLAPKVFPLMRLPGQGALLVLSWLGVALTMAWSQHAEGQTGATVLPLTGVAALATLGLLVAFLERARASTSLRAAGSQAI